MCDSGVIFLFCSWKKTVYYIVNINIQVYTTKL